MRARAREIVRERLDRREGETGDRNLSSGSIGTQAVYLRHKFQGLWDSNGRALCTPMCLGVVWGVLGKSNG